MTQANTWTLDTLYTLILGYFWIVKHQSTVYFINSNQFKCYTLNFRLNQDKVFEKSICKHFPTLVSKNNFSCIKMFCL